MFSSLSLHQPTHKQSVYSGILYYCCQGYKCWKLRRHQYANNTQRAIKLLKQEDVTVKTSASYHCLPTTALINPLSLCVWLNKTDGEGRCPCLYLYLRKVLSHTNMHTDTHTEWHVNHVCFPQIIREQTVAAYRDTEPY